MSTPDIEMTDDLKAAIQSLESTKRHFFGEGIDYGMLDVLIDDVRRVDAELVAARHAFRIREFYPYFPESFQPEEDGLEDAEKLLRAEFPKVKE